MKLGEFFVALGFDIKGDQQLAQLQNSLGNAESKAIGLLAGVTALNAAFYVMVGSAAQAAVSLGKYALATGMSADELQRWQYAGKLANVQATEMEGAFKALQNAQETLKLTGEGGAAFTFFGLSPNQSVEDTLRRLHEVIQTGDVGASRMMAQQLGISENVFQFLRQTNLGLDQFNAKLALTEEHRKNLVGLNRAWLDVVGTLDQLKNRFAETFTKPLTAALVQLKLLLTVLGVFVQWLGGTTEGARLARIALMGVVIAIGLLAVALTAVASILGVVIALVAVIELELAPLTLLVFIITAALVALGVAVVALGVGFYHLFDVIRQGKFIDNWLANARKSVAELKRDIEAVAKVMSIFTPEGLTSLVVERLAERAASPSVAPAGGRSVQNHADIDVHVDGTGSPQATGREVGKSVKQSVLEAFYQGAQVAGEW